MTHKELNDSITHYNDRYYTNGTPFDGVMVQDISDEAQEDAWGMINQEILYGIKIEVHRNLRNVYVINIP